MAKASITASSSATPGLVAFNNPTVIVGLIGLAIAIFFIVKGIRGGVLLSILVTTIIAIFAGVVDLGTVLTGGSQTSTSSADGGSNVYTFSDGSTITVKNGSKGSAGTTPTVKVASGTKIAAVGTPSVTAATSGTTTTFTFNYLKGQKGDKGDPGVNATTTAVATASANGLMSASDKSKLDGITTKLIVASTEPTANTNDIWYQEY